jgi:hypothetical protein
MWRMGVLKVGMWLCNPRWKGKGRNGEGLGESGRKGVYRVVGAELELWRRIWM